MKYDVILISAKIPKCIFPSPALALLKAILNRDTKYKSKTIDLSAHDIAVEYNTLLSEPQFRLGFAPVFDLGGAPLLIGIKDRWDKQKKIDFEFLREAPYKYLLKDNGVPIDECIDEFKKYVYKIRKIINSFEFSSIGISFLSSNILQAELIALIVREKDPLIPIIIGGPAVIQSRSTRNVFLKSGFADVVVYGEGEVCISRLIESLISNSDKDLAKIDNVCFYNNYEIIEVKKKTTSNLDTLPIPDYSDVDFKCYRNFWFPPALLVNWSRGCLFRCKFCSEWNLFSTKLRFKSPEYAVEEIETLMKKYEVKNFSVGDCLIDFSDEWMKKFCGLIEDKGLKFIWYGYMTSRLKPFELLKRMRKNGLLDVDIGVDSFDSRILKNMKKRHKNIRDIKESLKRITDAGIKVGINQITGYEGETNDIFINNLYQLNNLLKENNFLYLWGVQPFQIRPNSIDYFNPSVKLYTFDEVYPDFIKFIPKDIIEDVRNIPIKYESPTIPPNTTLHRCEILLLLKAEFKSPNGEKSQFFFDLDTDYDLFKNYYIKLKFPIQIISHSPFIIQLSKETRGTLNAKELHIFFDMAGNKRIIDYLEELYKNRKKKQLEFFQNFFLPLIVYSKAELNRYKF